MIRTDDPTKGLLALKNMKSTAMINVDTNMISVEKFKKSNSSGYSDHFPVGATLSIVGSA